MDGWTIGVSLGSFTNDTGYCSKVDGNDSWYGYSEYYAGSIKTTLRGCGKARLDFGSCHDRYQGRTNIYLNEKVISKASAGQLSKKIEFDFNEGDILKIEEFNSTLMFNNFTILSCCEKI